LILLSLDFETTGVDPYNDRIIEVGAVLYSTGQHKSLENFGCLVKTDKIITPEITGITGITQSAVDKFGYESIEALDILQQMVYSADCFIGYNCRRFDKRVYEQWVSLHNYTAAPKPWIDVFMDLPIGVPVGKLSHTAADHGILNLFPHSALADAQTVIAVASKYDPNLLLSRAQSPVVIAIAKTSRSENDLVKKAKFRWNPGRKIWWKALKQNDVDAFKRLVPFNVEFNTELTTEELDG